jgi:hypothetical protein
MFSLNEDLTIRGRRAALSRFKNPFNEKERFSFPQGSSYRSEALAGP